MNHRAWPRLWLWPQGRDVPPPQEPTPEHTDGDAHTMAEHQRRIVKNERRLDWLSQRVKRLEAMIVADTIAPVDPAEDGQSR